MFLTKDVSLCNRFIATVAIWISIFLDVIAGVCYVIAYSGVDWVHTVYTNSTDVVHMNRTGLWQVCKGSDCSYIKSRNLPSK